MDKQEAVKKYHVNAIFVGSDWKGTDARNQCEKSSLRLDALKSILNIRIELVHQFREMGSIMGKAHSDRI